MNQKISILDYRVVNNKGYSLLETLEILNEKSLNEGKLSTSVQKGLTLAIMALLDDATGEASGLIALLPILYKNIYELHKLNDDVEYILKSINKGEKDIPALKELRTKLITNVMDIINAIIIALPIPVVDTVGLAMVNMLQKQLTTGVADFVTKKFEQLSQSRPLLAKLLYVLSFPLGGSVIMDALRNIDSLGPDMIEVSLGLVDSQHQPDLNTIDVTPNVNQIDIMNDDDATEIIPRPPMNENYIVNRWQVLSGIN